MYSKDELFSIQQRIEQLPVDTQLEVLKILKKENVVLNNNNNGIFVNLSFYKDSPLIDKLNEFLEYTDKQEQFINIIEDKKTEIKNKYNV